MIKNVATILIILFLFAGASPVMSQQDSTEIKSEKTNPADGFRFLGKRIKEKIKLFIVAPFPKQKESVYEDLVQVRLAELKYVVEKPDPSNFEKATIRYSTTVGQWVEYINKKNLNDQKQLAVETLSSHKPILQKLMDTYDYTTAEWRFVKHDLDYLDIYISELK